MSLDPIVDNDTATVAFQQATSMVGEATADHQVAGLLTITAIGGGTPRLERDVSVIVGDAGGGFATGGNVDYLLAPATLTFANGAGNNATRTTAGLLTIVDDRRV